VAASPSAAAQCPSPQTPPKLANNNYAIELFQGPLLAPIHVTGVAGAYIASAEGTEGAAVNSASPAVRDPYSTSWFDYDLAVGVSFPGAFTNTDFDNHGSCSALGNTANNFADLTLGGQFQFGALGLSATGDLLQYQVSQGTQAASQSPFSAFSSGSTALTVQIGRWKVLGAYALLDGQLIVGGGARIITMQMLQSGTGTVLTMTGLGPEVGALLMPTGHRWRVGATARAPVSGGALGSENVTVASGGVREVTPAGSPTPLVLPSSLTQPWELEVGMALQLGPRPINPGWDNPHDQEAELRGEIARDRDKRALRDATDLAVAPASERERLRIELAAQEKALRAIEDEHMSEESARLRTVRKARYQNWPREKILLLASVLMTGPSQNALSVEGFFDQAVVPAGQSVTYTPRLGLEGEPLENRMLLRTGTYIEPSRYSASPYSDGTARQHFTFGADIHLFPLTFWGLLPDADWKLGLVVDLAPRYQNVGFGIGNWH
jgi:hypothetical protein